MASYRKNEVLILKENSEWLRYFFWGAVLGMCFLAASVIRAPEIDFGRLYGSAAGAALLGFCGFALRVRRVTADPAKRELYIVNKGFRQSSVERILYDEINNVQVLTVPGTYTDSNDRSMPCEDWRVALILKDRKVMVNANPSARKQVDDIAKLIQKFVQVKEVPGNKDEAIMALLQSGNKIDAIKLAVSGLGLTLEQAKDFVENKSVR